MSNNSTVYQPKLINELDPLLNISPLIDLYSSCLVHVSDIHCVLQLSSAHKKPIILSRTRRILNSSSLSYQRSFAGIRSFRCLLTIAALFFPLGYHPSPLLNYIIPTSYNLIKDTPTLSTQEFSRIYPQSFILVTNSLNKSIASYLSNVRKSDTTNDHSLYFALQLDPDLKARPRIFGGFFYKAFDSLVFNCSTFASCSSQMDRIITVVANVFHGSWSFSGNDNKVDGGHPFKRGVSVGVERAMTSFILGPKHQRLPNKSKQYRPYFKRIENGIIRTTPVEVIPAGRPIAVKFVTTAGVFTPKSSFSVYLSPFFPAVWLAILLSAGITVATMFGVYQMQGEVENGKLSLTLELIMWILAVAIGQFKHSHVPIFSVRQLAHRGVINIVVPVALAWFTDGGLQHDQKRLDQENKVGPLSFDNSGTSWTFRSQAAAWLVATGVFLVEILCH